MLNAARCIIGAALALSLFGIAAAKDLPAGESQTCDLLSEKEAAALLGHRPDIVDADGPEGALYCAWTVDNGTTIQNLLSITLIDGPALGGGDAAAYFAAARVFETAKGGRDVPGIGEAAVASPLADGSMRVLVRSGAWIGIVDGPGLPAATVLEAARLAGARFASVQHPLSHPALPANCAFLSLDDAAAALGHYPFMTLGDEAGSQTSCSWTTGAGSHLGLLIREGAALGGQSATDYFRAAAANAAVSQRIDEPSVGQKAYLAPADPNNGYFVLMLLQNDRIAVLSGLGIAKPAAIEASRAVAGRL